MYDPISITGTCIFKSITALSLFETIPKTNFIFENVTICYKLIYNVIKISIAKTIKLNNK